MDSCPAVVGANPPQVNANFFLVACTNSFPVLRRNPPSSFRPSTTDLEPSLSFNKASSFHA